MAASILDLVDCSGGRRSCNLICKAVIADRAVIIAA